jgi:hypothetical protein
VSRLVFLALDHDVRLEALDEGLARLAQHEGVLHHRDRAQALEPQRGRHGHAVGIVRIDADDQHTAVVGGKAQQAQMAGMHDVEVSGHERDALAGGDLAPDSGGNRLSVKCLGHARPARAILAPLSFSL